MRKYYMWSLLAALVALFGCNDDEVLKRKKVTVEGKIEKGPFQSGTKVYLYELDDPKNLYSVRNEHITTVLDDNGTYRFDDIEVEASYFYILANGYFYNEITGKKIIRKHRTANDRSGRKSRDGKCQCHYHFTPGSVAIIDRRRAQLRRCGTGITGKGTKTIWSPGIRLYRRGNYIYCRRQP